MATRGATILVLLLALTGCSRRNMVPYVPHVWSVTDAHPWQIEWELLESEKHLYEMMAALIYYGHDFEYREGKLLIEESLATDKGLIHNYNEKSTWVSAQLLKPPAGGEQDQIHPSTRPAGAVRPTGQQRGRN